MTRRTQSFFEQDHSSKSKGSYKSKSHKDDNPKSTSLRRTKSALPESETAKANSSSFAFAKPAAPKKSDRDEREPARPVEELEPQPEPARSEPDHPKDAPLLTRSKSIPGALDTPRKTPRRLDKFTLDAPHTPAPRIPLSQLIGGDDMPSATQPEETPQERVVWQTGTPQPNGKWSKGAKGSGPESPILLDTPAARRKMDGYALPDLGDTMRSPMEDPSTQLWKHYGPASGGNNPAARLFETAGVERSPFRRSVSTPEGLSAYRYKRKKADHKETPPGDRPGGGAASPGTPISRKKARVSRLIDQVKKNIDRQPSLPSSPLKNAGMKIDDFPSSPVRPKQKLSDVVEEEAEEEAEEEEKKDESDEFGDFDDDIDGEFLEQVDTIVSATQAASKPRAEPISISSSPPPKNVPIVDDDDDFGDDDDDLFNTEEFQSIYASIGTQAVNENGTTQGTGNTVRRRIQRFTVNEVTDEDYVADNGRTRPQIVIHFNDPSTAEPRRVLVRDSWRSSTIISPGQTLNVIGCFDKTGNCVVDDKHNYVVLHPDFLISATTVADTISCLRKSVLQERVKATNDISRPLVYGNILHALFQSALEAHDFSTAALEAFTKKLLVNYIQDLFILREDMLVATEYVRSKFGLLQDWAGRFIGAKPKPDAVLLDHRSKETPTLAINKLLDIEEHVWSPMYGLKGNIDATVQAIVDDGKHQKTLTLPLELKTGRNSKTMEHRGQTMLYTLLMSDRYDVGVVSGLLYYLETTETIRVAAVRNELRELIIKRNQVASYILDRNALPEMLQDRRTCGFCYAKTSCFMYHKLLEDGTPETSGVDDLFLKHTKHLNAKHQEFFKHWDNLLTKEETDSMKFRRELWTMTSSDREDVGRCFGDLLIKPGSLQVDPSGTKINKYTYIFAKQTPDITFSFHDSQLGVGDPIVVSDEKGHYALAIGYLSEIRRHEITVQVDRRLHNARSKQPGFHEASNQVFNGLFQINEDSVQHGMVDQAITYRVDKDEFSSGMAAIRNNLVQLMQPETSDRYRKLLVELEPPVFVTRSTPAGFADDMYAGLNVDQRAAVEKVRSAEDYALILGMPGTGKTTTIARIIQALVSQNKSVLLTSYTHTAVDNILLKLQDSKIPILRLGNSSKVHPQIPTFCSLATSPGKTFAEISATFNDPPIVATTCLTINHPVFSERRFDYCIVDEASQVTLPVCIGPLRFADRFVLVGDHYQLPPLVRNPEARDGGLDISLFKLLSDAHPQAVTYLSHQYRMCEDIMTLSNNLIYSGRLKCGTPEVAARSLTIPKPLSASSPSWLQHLLAPDCKAVFVDTDSLPAPELRTADRITNPTEARLLTRLAETLIHSGVPATEIGCISVYRSQLKLLQHNLRHHPQLELHTADKFQGRDKEVVLISLVRSNGDGEVGQLLRDWRRINVAFTRARSKLVVFASRKTLCANDMLRGFVELMAERGWVYELPREEGEEVEDGVEAMHGGAGEEKKENAGVKRKRDGGEGGGRTPKRINGKEMVVRRAEFLDDRPILRDVVNDLT